MIYGEATEKVSKPVKVCIVRSFKKCDKNELITDLTSAPWGVMETFDEIDDRWSYWKTLFLQVVNQHALLVRVRSKDIGVCEWIGSEIRSLMRTRNYFRKKHP